MIVCQEHILELYFLFTAYRKMMLMEKTVLIVQVDVGNDLDFFHDHPQEKHVYFLFSCLCFVGNMPKHCAAEFCGNTKELCEYTQTHQYLLHLLTLMLHSSVSNVKSSCNSEMHQKMFFLQRKRNTIHLKSCIVVK